MEYNKIKLIDCCRSISDGDHLPPPKSASGVPFITISNIDKDNYINFQETVFVPESYYDSLPDEKKAHKGDILYSVVGSFGKPVYIDYEKRFVFQRHIAILKPNNSVNPKYLYYTMCSPNFYYIADKMAIGAAQRTITLDSLRSAYVNIPKLEVQNDIVKVLECIDKKIHINRKINDNLQRQMCLIYENIMTKASNIKMSGKYIEAKDITDVVTGKEDANFSIVNGQYKFFTCSNIPLRCNEAAFDSASVLIAGNGDFNVKHYTGKFNAYQRTYVLTPPEKYYALLYLASLYHINSFKSSSAGSIVKFITKSDVEKIPIFVPEDNSCINYLNKLVRLQEQKSAENEKLIELRDWLLPMLMNGQAIIAD